MQRLDEFRGPHGGKCDGQEMRSERSGGGLDRKSVGHDGTGTGSGFGQSLMGGVRRRSSMI